MSTIEPTMGDVYAEVMKEDPNSLKLIADVLEQQARWDDSIRDSLMASTERDRDEWKARALNAEAEIRAIERRVQRMIFGGPIFTDMKSQYD